MNEIKFILGVDVQIKRPCTYYLLNSDLDYVTSGLLVGREPEAVCKNLQMVLSPYLERDIDSLSVGIDAPRMGLPKLRDWFWRGGTWVPRTNKDRGFGRHCEIVIKALGLGNPQWTRPVDESPTWMQLGYRLFDSLKDLMQVYEVFPSVSYHMLNEINHPPISLVLSGFAGQPKDMLDACVAAYTVQAFIEGRGAEVGGGDGLGTIIIPEKLPVNESHPVLKWPGQS